MVRTRAYRSRWLWVPAVVVSATAQGGAYFAYEVTRPEPKPTLTIRLDGEGAGQVLVTRVGDLAPLLRCAKTRCSVEVAPGTQLKLTAVLGEDATFAGYGQYPMRTPSALVPWLGDPLASCLAGDAVDRALRGDVLDCAVTIKADTDVVAEFGEVPKQVDVAFADPTELDKLIQPGTPKVQLPPSPIDAEKLEEQELQVAIAPPPPQIKQLQPPPPPPPEEKKPPPPPPKEPPPNMTMVEVQDKNLTEKAPDDAKFLSDKNRDVAEETRATKTNLDKESEGKAEASRESDDTKSAEVGGPEDKIRQLEETKSTTDKRI
ncbi:MAG TPA: hypothetical protein VIV40_38880, partial [Kofleriaceae bacterium]